MLFTEVAVKIVSTGNAEPEMMIPLHTSSETGHLKPWGPVW